MKFETHHLAGFLNDNMQKRMKEKLRENRVSHKFAFLAYIYLQQAKVSTNTKTCSCNLSWCSKLFAMEWPSQKMHLNSLEKLRKKPNEHNVFSYCIQQRKLVYANRLNWINLRNKKTPAEKKFIPNIKSKQNN